MEEKKLKKGGIGCLIIILVLITIGKPIIGISLSVLVFVGWVIYSLNQTNNKSKRNEQILKKYGDDYGKSILAKRLNVGMTKKWF
jgi:FtsH-binding integral membrane protein